MRCLALTLLVAAAGGAPGVEIRVPPGFTVELAAGPPAVRFPMFACTDDAGRLYVAESSGLDLYAELQALTRKCRVSRLEDADGDGRYERSAVFADKLVYPMGLVWRAGELYVADPPEVAALADDDGDGRADRRRRVLGDFGHLDNGSLHGLVFGPDGLLYMTMGSPDGYRLERARGGILSGTSGALIRCRPDGSNPEVIGRGFVNLVEVVFLPSGEIIGSDNWFSLPEDGVRDALVDIADGGLHPYVEDTGTRYPATGVALPAVGRYPAVALSGLELHSGPGMPPEMKGHVFCAQHNSRRVTRHRLVRHGSTFRAEDFTFAESDDPDFHPSDVLEDADGSLLVVDTGGWYVQHCPTGRIRSSFAPGGIHRVRWSESRRERRAGPSAAAAAAPAEDLRSSDAETVVRSARAVASRGDASRETDLIPLLSSPSLAVRRAAADALGRIGGARSSEPLIQALGDEVDAHLEHALILAIERTGGLEAISQRLDRPGAPLRVQRAALELLAAAPGKGPPRAAVAARLASSDPALRRTSRRILLRRPDWIDDALAVVTSLSARPRLTADDAAALADLVDGFSGSPAMVDLAARAAGGEGGASAAGRAALADAFGRCGRRPLPRQWTETLRRILRHGPADLLPHVLQAARAHGPGGIARELYSELAVLAADAAAPSSRRVEALALAAPGLVAVPPPLFDLLAAELARGDDPLSRLAAAEALAALRPTRAQAEQALSAWRGDSVLPRGLFDRLREQAAAVGAVDVPDPRVEVAGEEARARLAALEPLAAGGDQDRGRALFFGPRAACSTCHRIAARGGSVGPDLTRVGAIRSARDLLESIVAPSSTFAQGYEPWTLVAGDGQPVTGVIARRTEDAVTLRVASGAETTYARADLSALDRGDVSIMPEGIDRVLRPAELGDLLAYLLSLR